MSRKTIILIIVCVILFAIPCTMMVASGEFFPDNQEPYRVAIILPSNDVHGNYTSQSLVGAQAAQSEANSLSNSRDINIDLYIFDVDTPEILQANAEAFDSIVDTYDLVYGPSYNTLDVIKGLANAHPNVKFQTIDNLLDGENNNTANIMFRSQEVSFVTGYLAGMISKTNKVGVLLGVHSEALDYFYYGFKAGVDLASVQKGVPITVYAEYIGDFVSKNLGYSLTEKMFNQGADVVYTVAGDAGLGGIQAAVDMKKYVIGVDVDQNIEAPNNVLFSATKNIAAKVKDVILNYSQGQVYNGNISVGYKEDALDTVSYIDVVPKSEIEVAEVLKQAISEGMITVPKSEEEYKKWNVYSALAAVKLV